MIALHGVWWGSRFHVWRERSAQEPTTPTPNSSEARRPENAGVVRHPAALSVDGLRAVIGEASPDGLLAQIAEESSVTLWLPSVDGTPLPSSSDARGQSATGGRAELRPIVVPTLKFAPADAIDLLTSLSGPWVQSGSDSLRYWRRLARLVLSLLHRQQFAPGLERRSDGAYAARWRVFVRDSRELAWLERCAAAMPPMCRAVVTDCEDAAAPGALVDDFLLAGADALIRRDLSNDPFYERLHERAEGERTSGLCWLSGLVGDEPRVRGSAEDNAALASRVRSWLGRIEEDATDAPPALSFTLIEPEDRDDGDTSRWSVCFDVASDEAGRPFDIRKIWAERSDAPTVLGRHLVNRREHLLAELARAADVFAPLKDTLATDAPTAVELATHEAHTFLHEWGPMLQAQGFDVTLPSWAQTDGRQLGMEMHVRPSGIQEGEQEIAVTSLGLSSMLAFDWRVAVGQDQLTFEEFERITAQNAPLVKVHGQWVDLEPAAAAKALAFIRRSRGGQITLAEAIRLASGAEDLPTGLPIVGMRGSSWIEQLLSDVSDARLERLDEPPSFKGTLRPYQRVGLDWLVFLDRLGIGACLADDMGLGKTIEMIALLLHERENGRAESAATDSPGIDSRNIEAPAIASASRNCGTGVSPVSHHEKDAGATARPSASTQLRHRRPACDPAGETPMPQLSSPQFSSRAEKTPSASNTEDPASDAAGDTHDAFGRLPNLAALQKPSADAPGPGPTLLFAPMSVVGNWEREIARFAPMLRVLVHHGPERLAGTAFAEAALRHDVVITTYGLAQRDLRSFGRVDWHRIALDEAQKIKNPSANQTIAIRSLRSRHRVALTGTPIENHLSELWSIMEMLNPGLLGSAAAFRKRFAMPIEKLGDRQRADQLRRMIRPFVLRRLKSDPDVACDLPDKMEMRVYCNLTPEQAALYEKTVNRLLGEVDAASGIRRRGLILATLTKLKQVCNHPSHLLRDDGPLDRRSGKCERLAEMLDEVLAEGDAALIFTQYREMGDLLIRFLSNRLRVEIPFLHGGTMMKQRERMITDFQNPASNARLFLLSLKAGGFGLNLTKANHVFHFDRWWNPAVENQATDRVHRIGQTRQVQVHKFVCIGTIEDRIDQLLTEKAALADQIVGSGDAWLTSLSTAELRDYLRLSREAIAES